MKKSLVITHADLDGAISYAILCWYKQASISVKATSQAEFARYWQTNVALNLDQYEKIYVFDLNVGDLVEALDHHNVTIVDHHQESIDRCNQFKHAKVFCSKETSTSLLLYKTLKKIKKGNFLTKRQKIILLVADDYEQYAFRLPITRDVNYLFWSYQGDRVTKFYEEFKNGFFKFTDQQKNLISFYKKRLTDTIQNLKYYLANIKIKNTLYKFASVFADFGINDVAEHVLKIIDADVVIIVNLKLSRVSFRKRNGCKLPLNKLAKSLSNGGGHEDAAGGILNDTFINFSKSFNEYEFQQHTQGGNRPSIEVLL